MQKIAEHALELVLSYWRPMGITVGEKVKRRYHGIYSDVSYFYLNNLDTNFYWDYLSDEELMDKLWGWPLYVEYINFVFETLATKLHRVEVVDEGLHWNYLYPEDCSAKNNTITKVKEYVSSIYC